MCFVVEFVRQTIHRQNSMAVTSGSSSESHATTFMGSARSSINCLYWEIYLLPPSTNLALLYRKKNAFVVACGRTPKPRETAIAPVQVPPFDLLHPELQDLATRCFEDGHLIPNSRPSAEEWAKALEVTSKDQAFLSRVDRLEAQALRDQIAAATTAAEPQGTGSKAPVSLKSKQQTPTRLRKMPVVIAVACLLLAVGTYWYVAKPSRPKADPDSLKHIEAVYGPGKPTPKLWKELADEPY